MHDMITPLPPPNEHQKQPHLPEESLGEDPNIRERISGNFHQPQRSSDHGTAFPHEERGRLLTMSESDEESEITLVLTEPPHLSCRKSIISKALEDTW